MLEHRRLVVPPEGEGSTLDDARLTPPSDSHRALNTSVRLRRQGFTQQQSTSLSGFVVRSIRRGSEEWNSALRPFVSDLTFRSLEYRRFQSDVSFRPYTCHAVVLFVDLSNYSKITAEIAHKGAYAISAVVNEYLSRLLAIACQFGGDIVKFAGDAVLIVWDGEESEIKMNLLAAAKCSLEMQDKAGVYIIEGTSLCFRIHCGLSVGLLESEIFVAPNHVNMQQYFHSVSGECIREISELVDIAKAGEICVSSACVEYLGNRGRFIDVSGHDDCKLLTNIALDDATLQTIESHLENVASDRLVRRNRYIEEDFIHPTVLRLFVLGGKSPTQIAQMRNLCVLFIAMTSIGSVVNWLIEVQTILDKNRCPIVQIIHDDKGVHVVAAINLYESIPESSLMGLAVCKELVEQEVGCAIGMAQGSTFCGVTGCFSVACRWDITGPPAVRAARLMQYALCFNLEVAIDQSVYNDNPMTSSKLTLYNKNVTLKGTKYPIPVYTLSSNTTSSAFRVLETKYAPIHEKLVKRIAKHITLENRSAVLVTGAPLTGKKIVCQQAAGVVNLVPYLHLSDESLGFVQLAQTIATWLQYIDCDQVNKCATKVLCHLGKNRWSRAHDECISLISLAMGNGINACFVVDRVQHLDDFSLSLIRECLHKTTRRPRSYHKKTETMFSPHGLYALQSAGSTLGATETGKLCFLCVHVPLYNCKSAEQIVNEITRSHKSLNIPMVTVGEATKEELQTMSMLTTGVAIAKRHIDVSGPASGFCAGYFAERNGAFRNVSSKLWSEGKIGLTEINNKLEVSIPPGALRAVATLPVTRLDGEVAMKFSRLFDVLPPLLQTFCKVLAIASRTTFYKLPKAIIWSVLNDLMTDGVENDVFDSVLGEMIEMKLLKVDLLHPDMSLAFQCPALGDIAFEVCTPIQLKSIARALIERLVPHLKDHFTLPFVMANLHDLVGDSFEQKVELCLLGYNLFVQESKSWDIEKTFEWKEMIGDEIRALGYNPSIVMGKDANWSYSFIKSSVSENLNLLKQYHSPIAFGPLGLSLSVITVNVYFLCGEYYGFDGNRMAKIREDLLSGCNRYLREVNIIESFLSKNGCLAAPGMLFNERRLISDIGIPAKCMNDVEQKASILYNDLIPTHVIDRICRIHKLAQMIRSRETPEIVQTSEKTILHAYEAFKSPKSPYECAQDAIMILATGNWRARPIPEHLPLYHVQSLVRIRNKVLKQLSEAEIVFWKHQQSPIDLEAFLIVSLLIYNAQEKGEC